MLKIGPHPAAGRGADDARAGVRRLRRHDRRGHRRGSREAAALLREVNLGGTAIGTGINAPSGLRRARRASTSREITGMPTGRGAEPGRGHPGHRRLRAAVRACSSGSRSSSPRSATTCACFRQRPARRAWRDQPAARAGRLVDHAGQGQPGDPRGGQPGRLPGDRQRPHGDDRRRGRAAAAQRRSSRSSPTGCSRAWSTSPPLRRWPRGASTGSPPTATCSGRECRLDRPGHRAEPLYRLRERHRRGPGGADQRPRRGRDRRAAGAAQPRADRRGPERAGRGPVVRA